MGFMEKYAYKKGEKKVHFDKFSVERTGSRFTPRKSSKHGMNEKLKM